MELFTEQMQTSQQHLKRSDGFVYFADEFAKVLLSHLTYSVPADEKIDVVRFLYFCSKELKLHTLFTTAGIIGVIETVFDNSSVRDFVLSLSDKYFIAISNGEMEQTRSGAPELIAHIANGLKDYSVSSGEYGKIIKPNSIIPEKILLNIGVENVSEILKANQWIMAVVMCNIVFPDVAASIKLDIAPK